jgi:uncharacterized protein (TIGR03083 family)
MKRSKGPRSGWPHGPQGLARPGPASGKLLLRTGGACDFDPEHLLGVFGEQRQRFVTALQGFGPDDWAAPTRCADWSAHDVVRHLCDTNAIITGTDDRRLDVSAGFDPRITPREWLTASAGESPDATLGRLAATTEEMVVLSRARLAQGLRFDVRLPYGPMDWTVLVLHAFWDSWIHERDVLLARGAQHPADDDAIVYVTAYGLFLAAAVASMFGDQVQEKLQLGGDGGGVFDLDSRGAVNLTVSRVTTAGPPAAEVADALAGRSPVAAVLGDLPANSRTALSHLADFFSTPVEQSPT